MPLDLDTALNFARATGGDFSADALTRHFGGSKRDNAPLAAQAKIAIAGEAMRERLDALEAAGVAADIVAIFSGLAEAFGEATLRLEDALRRRREQEALGLAAALQAAEARIKQAVARERAAAEASRAAQEALLEAARRRIADLQQALAATQAQRDEALVGRGEAAARLQAAQEQQAALAQEVQALRRAKVAAEERAATHAQQRERLTGELIARQDAQWST